MFSHFISSYNIVQSAMRWPMSVRVIIRLYKSPFFLDVSTLEQINQIRTVFVVDEGNLSIGHQAKNC